MDLNDFDFELPWNTKKVFSKNDAEEILTVLSSGPSRIGLCVFYKVDDIMSYVAFSEQKTHILFGNEKYNSLCEEKSKTFSEKFFSEKVKVVLISDDDFRINPFGGIYISSCQTVFSFNSNNKYFVRAF